MTVAGLDLGFARYSRPDARNFQRRALEAIARLPGVTAAAYASSVPLSIDQSSTMVFAEKETDLRPSKAKQVSYYDVSPGYFRAMGTRFIAGRDFTWQDGPKPRSSPSSMRSLRAKSSERATQSAYVFDIGEVTR